MASLPKRENYGGLHNLDSLFKKIDAELPGGSSFTHGLGANVTFTTLQVELLLLLIQLAQVLAFPPEFLNKISALLQVNVPSSISEQPAESPSSVLLEGPPIHVNLQETPLLSATLAPNTALIRTGKPRALSFSSQMLPGNLPV